MTTVRRFKSIQDVMQYNRALSGGLAGGRFGIKATTKAKGIYQLKKGFNSKMDVNVIKQVNGYRTYGYIQLEPGKKYPIEDDEGFMASIRDFKLSRTYDENLINMLKQAGVEYEEKVCPTCGGRVKRVLFNPVEVIE